MKTLYTAIVINCIIQLTALQATISIVYNVRVAETSKRLGIEPLLSDPWLGAFTFFNTYRKKYNGVKHNAVGGLFTFDYTQENYFVRVDTAVARVMSNTHGVKLARTQGDDILFSGGYSKAFSDKLRATLSGFIGLPTHNDTSIALVQFGYGHYALGVQLDGSWRYSGNKQRTLRGAARLIHFFPRNVCALKNDLLHNFTFAPGNLVDIFVALHNKFNLHSVEVGYNGSFFFDGRTMPYLDDAVKQANYIRHSFYALYKYRFKIFEHTQALTLAFSGGV